MKLLNRNNTHNSTKYPIKIIQFGEGNFLRAFVSYAVHILNKKSDFKAGIAVVQPIATGLIDSLNRQDGLYTLFTKGIYQGKETKEKELITSIVKGVDPYKQFQGYLNLAREDELAFIVSNTTEAGIAYNDSDNAEMRPPSSFPAKLTLLLFERYKYFNGAKDKGIAIIPCELINYNADTLKSIILKYIDLWGLDSKFKDWILKYNSFHNTLVDRIVPGYPKDEIEEYNKQLDYRDNLIVAAEKFFLWIIEGDDLLKAKLPFDKTDLNVLIVDDMQPYRTRKVRILNGAHTIMTPLAILYGNSTVKETIDSSFTGNFVKNAVFNEIIQTLGMNKHKLQFFAVEVFDRFRNPFIKHLLSSIALNSISKFKVRVLPSLLKYEKINNKLPVYLTFALACLIRFYKGSWSNNSLPVKDDKSILTWFKEIWESSSYDEIAKKVLSNSSFWDQDLSKIKHLSNSISIALEEIDANGIKNGFENFKIKV